MRFLYLQEIKIPPNSVFVGNCYQQHSGPGRKGHHGLRYHTYVSSVDYSLQDAIEFGYGGSLNVNQLAKSGKVVKLATDASPDSSENESGKSEIEKWILETSDIPDA